MKTRISFIPIIILILSVLTFSQEGVRVETSGTYNGANITPEECQQKALEIARSEAIKQVVGLNIKEEIYHNVSETMINNNPEEYIDLFSRLSHSTANGRILKEDYAFTTKFENDIPIYTAHLHALVVTEKINPDPGFEVKINLSKDVFYDRDSDEYNDEVNFKIWASKDCYLYLFNIMFNDSVQLVIPNKVIENNFYQEGMETQEFEKQIKNLNIKFRVKLSEGKTIAREAFYLIALKDKVDFTSSNLSKDQSSIIPTYRAAITDITNWLIKIPSDRRTEAFASFEIRKR